MALNDLLNKAKEVAEKKLTEKVEKVLAEAEKSGEEKEKERNNLLNTFLPLAPKYIQDIINNKEILIPNSIIEERLKDKVKSINFSNEGIELVVNKENTLINLDVDFKLIIQKINLKKRTFDFLIKDINIKKADESNFIQGIISSIAIPVVKTLIEGIIQEEIQNLSNAELKFKNRFLGKNLEMVCDFSGVEKTKMFLVELPIIKKSFVDIVKVENVYHTDDCVKLSFDVKIK